MAKNQQFFQNFGEQSEHGIKCKITKSSINYRLLILRGDFYKFFMQYFQLTYLKKLKIEQIDCVPMKLCVIDGIIYLPNILGVEYLFFRVWVLGSHFFSYYTPYLISTCPNKNIKAFFFQKVNHIVHKAFDEKKIVTSKASIADREKLSKRISTSMGFNM